MAGVRNVLQLPRFLETDGGTGTDTYLRLPKLVSHE